MRGLIPAAIFALGALSAAPDPSGAQNPPPPAPRPVTRVIVAGPGTHFRGQGINLWVPNPAYLPPPSAVFMVPPYGGYYYPSFGAFGGYPPAMGFSPTISTPPPPAKTGPEGIPVPQKKTGAMTLADFAKNFRPGPGNHEATLINPITNQPATVRFTLPEGSPQQVNVGLNGVEFLYGPSRYVRIQFDKEGAFVISR